MQRRISERREGGREEGPRERPEEPDNPFVKRTVRERPLTRGNEYCIIAAAATDAGPKSERERLKLSSKQMYYLIEPKFIAKILTR